MQCIEYVISMIHCYFLKLIGLVINQILVAFFWLSIDPFNMRGPLGTGSSFVWSLYFALYVCVFPLVLRIWYGEIRRIKSKILEFLG
jgi:hypothetical protein